MSLPVPLSVLLSTSQGSMHVAGRLRDLSFRTVAPGGFASATMSLSEPIIGQPAWLDYYGRVYIYDSRSGATVWEGRLEDPGRGAGGDGEVWDLVAVGPSAHAQDRNVPIIYVDRSMEDGAWPRADLIVNQSKGGVSRGDGTSNAPTIRLEWDPGQSIAQNRVITARYVRLGDTGQWIARVSGDHTEGAASTTLRVELVSRRINGYVGSGSDTILETDNWTTGNSALLQRYGLEHTDKFNAIDTRLRQSSVTAPTSNDNYWTNITNLVVIGSRYLRDGTEQLSGYTAATVLASEVVADLLGRLLVQYDGAGASIATTSYAIDQLAYPDGVNAAGVLDDLMALEPAYLWEALESTATGKHRFVWRTWPVTVRYEADVRDGYDGAASADGLYNACTVRYRDVNGRSRAVRVTQSVPQLTAAGLIREPRPLDLGDEVGSSAAATQAGREFLADHQYPRNAGRLRISRPILDADTGAMVQPWEIRPGYLIRVRGVLPRVDALNPPAAGRDGVTVFRIVANNYQASDATASLELDSYAPSTARALATLLARPVTRRR